LIPTCKDLGLSGIAGALEVNDVPRGGCVAFPVDLAAMDVANDALVDDEEGKQEDE
jgi:hypothetical protein